MTRSVKIYIAVLVIILIATIAYDSSQPKPVDWAPTYSLKDKTPFGLYVLDNEMSGLLKGRNIQKHSVTPYEYLDSKINYDTLGNRYNVKGCIMGIVEFSNIDGQSAKEICHFVSRGNSAFLSSKNFPQELLDSLNLEMRSGYKYSNSIFNWVANPKLGSKKYHILESVSSSYFSKIDTVNTTVLGYQSGDSSLVNFVRVRYKNGDFYLHTQPGAFTNFHLLKRNHYEYAEKVLSYVPNGDVFWFIKNQGGDVISASPMRYILSQPALKWAWYLFLAGMAVFIFFNARRKQRIVPIIIPLANTTVDFTKSIGNLYYQEGDHDNIITKKIIYFLEKIRNEYLIDTNKLDDDFIKKLHLKSGKELTEIKRAVFLINMHRKSPHNSIEEDLIQISNAIEKII